MQLEETSRVVTGRKSQPKNSPTPVVLPATVHHDGMQCVLCGGGLIASDKVVYGEKSYVIMHERCAALPDAATKA